MSYLNRPIFRTEAVQYYLQSQEKAALPRFIAPRVFIFLWIVLAGLVSSAGLSLLAPLPVYATGQAVVLSANQADQAVQLVAFLPPEYLARLQIGQKLFLGLDDKSEHLTMLITVVGPRVISPEEARLLFDLNPGAAAMITQPVAVVMANWQPPAGGLPATSYIGSIGQADVEIGQRQILSFLLGDDHAAPVSAEHGDPAGGEHPHPPADLEDEAHAHPPGAHPEGAHPEGVHP